MKEKFLTSLKEVLEIEDRDILLTDQFRDYDEWDSLGRLSLIAMMDEDFGVTIEDEEFSKLVTVEDLFYEIQKRSDTAA